jgi:hypothetical protein
MTTQVKLTARVWSKPVTQQVIKQLRNAGMTVKKINNGYECHVGNELIFKAMIGTQGYLVRFNPEMFE